MLPTNRPRVDNNSHDVTTNVGARSGEPSCEASAMTARLQDTAAPYSSLPLPAVPSMCASSGPGP
ncbi:hypothetical protein [Coralloluteibacterium stylophorae]|uniref:Uncharacterized protein n=1 Tax=Coralloluteibacterium stylophorae TaxID=1776034 RepID=A0A8J7VQC8_9GAMM|nr:hypothetical protein [Coralloluteibacterium stylophorae]MBS7456916.1 hypothetical protein [Coralloluteibacterium stylophorae]